MKISDILQNQKIPGTNRTSGPGAGGADFAAILQGHLQGVEGAGAAGATSSTPAIASTVPAQLRLESLHLSETAISTLDSFGTALGNPELQTRELEPYINALESDVAAMLELKKELPAEDPLNKILEQVATVSFLETAKYRRGDYH